MAAKNRNSAMTMVELIVVLTIIALLMSILIPVVTSVRKAALEAKQFAQITVIEQALEVYKNDSNLGSQYPDSYRYDNLGVPFNGAQRLAEALVGRDMFGYHPNSEHLAADPNLIYPQQPFNMNQPVVQANINARKKPFIDTSSNVYSLKQLFKPDPNASGFDSSNYVICDVFANKRVVVGSGKVVTAGRPILYYKAEPIKLMVQQVAPTNQWVYNSDDNFDIVTLYDNEIGVSNPPKNPLLRHDLIAGSDGLYFYDPSYKIVDAQASAGMAAGQYKPYNMNSYLLISAGYDGLYGTPDDITNIK